MSLVFLKIGFRHFFDEIKKILLICESRKTPVFEPFLSENAEVRYLPKTVRSVYNIMFFASSGFFKSLFSDIERER